MAEMAEMIAYPLAFASAGGMESRAPGTDPIDTVHMTSSYGRSIFRRWFIRTSATTLASLGAAVSLVGLILGA